MSAFDHLECALKPVPLFPVEKPDGRKDLSELDRQSWFVNYMRRTQPHILVYANVNAAKRGPKAIQQARKEGMRAGVFDITCAWDIAHAKDDRPTVAWCEFKGYSASGAAGKLTDAQIEFGNDLHTKGIPAACFFSAKSCINWLRSIGAPLQGTVA